MSDKNDYHGCVDECKESGLSCGRNSCRHWLSYEEDLNCSLIASERGPLTLEEVSKRMGMTLVRVKQIQDAALEKLKKRILPVLHE